MSPDRTAATARTLAAEVKAAADSIRAALTAGEPVDPEDLVTLTGSAAGLQDLAEASTRPFPLQDIQVPEDQWEANGNKSSPRGDDWRCMVCNRGVNPERAAWVHMTGGLELLPLKGGPEVDDVEDSMGMQPVGADCARRIPPAYRERT